MLHGVDGEMQIRLRPGVRSCQYSAAAAYVRPASEHVDSTQGGENEQIKAKLGNLFRFFSWPIFLFACLFFFGAAGDFYD